MLIVAVTTVSNVTMCQPQARPFLYGGIIQTPGKDTKATGHMGSALVTLPGSFGYTASALTRQASSRALACTILLLGLLFASLGLGRIKISCKSNDI